MNIGYTIASILEVLLVAMIAYLLGYHVGKPAGAEEEAERIRNVIFRFQVEAESPDGDIIRFKRMYDDAEGEADQEGQGPEVEA